MKTEIQDIPNLDPAITIKAEIIISLHRRPTKLRYWYRLWDLPWSQSYWRKWDCVRAARAALDMTNHADVITKVRAMKQGSTFKHLSQGSHHARR